MRVRSFSFHVCRLPKWNKTAWLPRSLFLADDVSRRVYLDVFRLRLYAIKWGDYYRPNVRVAAE